VSEGTGFFVLPRPAVEIGADYNGQPPNCNVAAGT